MFRPCVCLALLLLAVGVARPAVEVTGVLVDGIRRPLDVDPRNLLNIPHGASTVEFYFDVTPDSPEAIRLRYQLEPVDPGWVDFYSHMRMVVRFLDVNDQIIAATELKAGRESAGWVGRAEDSPFHPRRLEVTAPGRAVKLQLWCVSGGPEPTTGIYAFQNVVVRVKGAGERVTRFSNEAGSDLDYPLGSPAAWNRDGSRPEMARVIRLNTLPARHALALVDNDPGFFAAWIIPPSHCVPVREGEKAVVEWEDAYSIGRSGPGIAIYRNLAPGNYSFRAVGVNINGWTSGREVSLPLVILPQVWRRLGFWLAVFGGGALASMVVIRRVTQTRLQRRLSAVERQHGLEQERARIARDIHDDLGANLAEIAMLTELARDEAQAEVREEHLGEIFVRAHEATRRLGEIVWAINPANDTLEHFISFLCKFTQDHLALARMALRLNLPESLPDRGITSHQRHNLFLAAKEAIHNAVSHSHATEVILTIGLEKEIFTIILSDNGTGFDPAEAAALKRGLANMRRRLQQVHGRFAIQSTPGAGTTVTFSLLLP